MDERRDGAESGGAREKLADNVTAAPFKEGPRRQLRRTGTKIGRKVLPFERLLFRIGPLHLYRGPENNVFIRWVRRRRRR